MTSPVAGKPKVGPASGVPTYRKRLMCRRDVDIAGVYAAWEAPGEQIATDFIILS
jgi:hypothetical protein